MSFDPGLPISPIDAPLGFSYGPGCFGPTAELRPLASLRRSLLDPDCSGPDPTYAIAMDVGRQQDRADLVARNLLFGAVVYARGRLGREPVRSQGHVHQPSPRHGWSTAEVYEIWRGRAVVLMQESSDDDPGRCFAVAAGPGEVVVVPPGWAHATISADPNQPLAFGAWCDRDYGFLYDGVRAHGGLAWFPLLNESGGLVWRRNPAYVARELQFKAPRPYTDLGLEAGTPIYRQYLGDRSRFSFVTDPGACAAVWRGFTP